MPPAQDHRVAELKASHERVITTPMPDGTLAVLAFSKPAKRKRGEPEHRLEVSELLDAQGYPLGPDEVIRRLGDVRRTAIATADAALEHLTGNLAVRARAGEELNIAAIRRETDLSRTTIYRRLTELGVPSRAA